MNDTRIKKTIAITCALLLAGCSAATYQKWADKQVDSIIRNSIINEGALIQSATLEGSLIGESARVEGEFQRLNVGDSSVIRFGG